MKRWILLGSAFVVLMGHTATGHPAAHAAQTARIVPGTWEGSLVVAGTYESWRLSTDGTESTRRIEIGSNNTNFELTVQPDGSISAGSMNVFMDWKSVTISEAPVTFDPVHITAFKTETGSIPITGDNASVLAAGELLTTDEVFDTEGILIEEVSDSEAHAVEWVFEIASSDCSSVTGVLSSASGESIMRTIPGNQFTFEDNFEATNLLTAGFWAYPVFPDADVVGLAIVELQEFGQSLIAAGGAPNPQDLLLFIKAAEQIHAELAGIELCSKSLPPGFVPGQVNAWLADIVRTILNQALEQSGAYTPQQLITMLNAGVRTGAVDGDLSTNFQDALTVAISNALATGDSESLVDIAIAAGQYGYADVKAAAIEALDLLMEEES